jgi:hypothetical protein
LYFFLGSCLIFYEKKQISNGEEIVWAPKALSLLSQWSFRFDKFLHSLYRILRTSSPICLEKYLGIFFHRVPVPIYGQRVVYNPFNDTDEFCMSLKLRPPCDLPQTPFSISTLFQYLSIHNIIKLLGLLLTDKKVIFVSDDETKLTPACQNIISLMFPFEFCYPFVPILPRDEQYLGFLECPMPLLCGVHRSFYHDFDFRNLEDGIFIVDLDQFTNESAQISVVQNSQLESLESEDYFK